MKKVTKLKRYDVVTFDKDDKIVVLEACDYNGNHYVYVNEILPDESDVTDVYKVMVAHPEDGTLEKVIDQNLLMQLLPIFHDKLKQYDAGDENKRPVIDETEKKTVQDDTYEKSIEDHFPKANQHSTMSMEWSIECLKILTKVVANNTTPLKLGSIKVTYAVSEIVKEKSYSGNCIMYSPIYNNEREIVDYIQPDATWYPNEVAEHLTCTNDIYKDKDISNPPEPGSYYLKFNYCHIIKSNIRDLNLAIREVMNELERYCIYHNYLVEFDKPEAKSNSEGCYIATAVYGSYDCPEVWTFRRYRDDKLRHSFMGRRFVKVYYAISPTIVSLFGDMKWFNRIWKGILDKVAEVLKSAGYEDTPYCDR